MPLPALDLQHVLKKSLLGSAGSNQLADALLILFGQCRTRHGYVKYHKGKSADNDEHDPETKWSWCGGSCLRDNARAQHATFTLDDVALVADGTDWTSRIAVAFNAASVGVVPTKARTGKRAVVKGVGGEI